MKRAGFLSVHRWLGLILAPFLILQALTGAFLVLREMTLPESLAATAPVSTLRAGAEAAQPGFRVKRIFLPGSTGPLPFAEMARPDGATVYAELDPATGRALTTGALWRFPYRAVVQVHYRLADGTTGMVVVLALGTALALAALSGLVFWWPGRTRLLQALKVRRNLPARLRLRQWHRSVGAVTAALALYSAVTGVLLIAPDVTDALSSPAAGGPVTAPPPAASAVLVDRAITAAQARFPEARLRDVRLPMADRVDVNFDAPEHNPRAVHTVSVRLSDGTLTKALAARDNPAVWMKVLALHTGQSFALPGMILLLAEAAALIFLAWAGTRMWLAARRKDKR